MHRRTTQTFLSVPDTQSQKALEYWGRGVNKMSIDFGVIALLTIFRQLLKSYSPITLSDLLLDPFSRIQWGPGFLRHCLLSTTFSNLSDWNLLIFSENIKPNLYLAPHCGTVSSPGQTLIPLPNLSKGWWENF